MGFKNSTIDNIWSHIQLYNLYRLIVAGVLVLVSLSDRVFIQASLIDNGIVNTTITVYTLVVILGNILCYSTWPTAKTQIYLAAIIDIVTLLIVISFSTGVNFGIGVLLILPVLIPNLLSPSPYSLLLTALSIIALLSIEAWKQMPEFRHIDNIFHTGVLSFFIILASWLSTKWSSSAFKTAELAKQQRLDLANLSELNQTILDQLTTGIIVTDNGTTIRHMNSMAQEILGNPDHWYKQRIDHFAPELGLSHLHWHRHTRPRSSIHDIKHQSTTELRARFVQLGNVGSGGALIYLNDTHEEREQLQGMKLASLGQLTANIAHEIRNPLGAISHAAQLLGESDNLDNADKRLMQIVQDNSSRMNLTIESVLNLSRRKKPNRKTLLLRQWLCDFFDDFILQSELERSQLTLFVEPSDIEIRFDPAHLHQILWNLCRNALKYAHHNQAELQLLVQGSIPNYTRDVVLNVIDNGYGITDQQLERLFEPFYTTSNEGTGLGLFMSRELCQANGAELEYVKIPSGGSCFRINFTRV